MDMIESLSREAIFISALGRTLYRMRHLGPNAKTTIADIVEHYAKATPDQTAILFQERAVSYAELDAMCNRVAHWGLAQGLKPRDVVALFMENRPEYLMIWIGLAKIGVISALINTNLRGNALAHCVNTASAQHVIIGTELSDAYAGAATTLENSPASWFMGDEGRPSGNFDHAIAQLPPDRVDLAARADIKQSDKALYIFTSGTTGLPKAANITHMRMLFMMYGFAGALNAKSHHRIYDPLPLYHSTGGICAVGVAFTVGGTLVIRRKFSVHEFWEDCYCYKPDFFQYIGELCRYLLNAPRGPHEHDHNIRMIVGNGLRPEIWSAFQSRFAIPKIIEFYGATEGNVSMLNYDGKVGAVGRIPSYLRGVLTTRLVRFDVEKELPIRGADGLCIEASVGEAGEAIGKITKDPMHAFDGYTRATDTQKKILNDVFKKDDSWFRTGDLMRRDEYGYFYFVDRIGDTFRWKGENVATSEVSEALGVMPGVLEANVYGVSIPGMDGRAGMAALVTGAEFDVKGLAQRAAKSLPAYAVPIFLRITQQLEVTGTFKQRKVELVKEGFDPFSIADPIFWLDPATGDYEKLDAARYADIISGRARL